MIPRSYPYADCRGILRHSWHEVSSDWASPRAPGVPMTLRCERCDMERRDVIGVNTGEVVYRRYIQPPMYRIDGDRKPKIKDFRLAWLEDTIARNRANRKDKK